MQRFSPQFLRDAQQQALGFLTSQLSYIEPQVNEIQYPDVQYPLLVPVDTSASEWAKSITYYSSDKVGKAGWFHAKAKDIHIADVDRARNEVGVEMADIGYRYDIEEIGTALLENRNLTVDKAAAAKRAYEEFVDDLALRGATEKNLAGIINYPGITIINAADVTGAFGTSSNWAEKSPDQILEDINFALIGVWSNSLTVEMADTILLPLTALSILASRRLGDTNMTILDFIATKNVVTLQTGRPILIRGVRGLETAGVDGVGRMIVYRRDPAVLKMHIPMPHRFFPPFHSAPLVYDIPGVFRVAGVEVRRPGAFRYVDGIQGADITPPEEEETP